MLCAGDGGHGVGVLRRAEDGVDGVGAAGRAGTDRAGVLRGRGAAVDVCIPGAGSERGVHGCMQLRAVHGEGGEVERAVGNGRVLLAGRHRGLHSLPGLPWAGHLS
jgi:hypothetical protein